jgi:hypothetical protein
VKPLLSVGTDMTRTGVFYLGVWTFNHRLAFSTWQLPWWAWIMCRFGLGVIVVETNG